MFCHECVLTCYISYAIHAESKTKNTKRKWSNRCMKSVCVCIGVRESRRKHRYIYLRLHMRPWFVWPTCTCQWLSSVLFAQSCSLTWSRLTLQDPATPRVSPAHSPPENGLDKSRVLKKDAAPNSPASVASSGSTPSSKAKDHAHVSGHTERLDRRWNKEVNSGGGDEWADRLKSICQVKWVSVWRTNMQ